MVAKDQKRKNHPHKQTKPNNSGDKAENSDRKEKAIDLVIETVESLYDERGEDSRIWSSMVKQAIKRINPGFNERYHGFKSFNSVLEEAQKRGLLTLQVEGNSGGYVVSLSEDS